MKFIPYMRCFQYVAGRHLPFKNERKKHIMKKDTLFLRKDDIFRL